MDLSIRVIALMLCRDRSHFAFKHPHLSVVQIFKDHRCAKLKSPSAAQKRDYEPLPYFRQAAQRLFLNHLTLLNPLKPPPPQERGAFYGFINQRQHLTSNTTIYELAVAQRGLRQPYQGRG